MRAARIVPCCLALATLLCGCEPWFVHPAYLPGDTVFEPALVGTWVSPAPDSITPSDRERFCFEPESAGVYRVIRGSTEPARDSTGTPADSAVFRGHAFRLDGQLFLDLEPVAPLPKHAPGRASLHRIWRVATLGDTLRLGGLSEAWLREHARRRDLAVRIDTLARHVEDDMVVRNGTAEVRALLSLAVRDTGAFQVGDPKVRRAGTAR